MESFSTRHFRPGSIVWEQEPYPLGTPQPKPNPRFPSPLTSTPFSYLHTHTHKHTHTYISPKYRSFPCPFPFLPSDQYRVIPSRSLTCWKKTRPSTSNFPTTASSVFDSTIHPTNSRNIPPSLESRLVDKGYPVVRLLASQQTHC